MFVILVLQIIFTLALIVGLYQKNTNAICKSKRRLDGKTVLVTGGTSGMGLEMATDFAHRGAKVIVACPFEDEGCNGKKKIIKSSGNENVIFKILDLASLASVRKFAAEILESEDRLDILVNNAGVGMGGGRVTKDGLNFLMQVNYFGSFLLTLLLLPILEKSGNVEEPSRIVNTASVLHRLGRVNFANWNEKKLDVFCYSNSKLCVVLFTRELAKRLKHGKVVVNVVDPGAVGTNIFKNATGKVSGAIVSFLFFVLFKQPWEGAQTAIYVSMSKTAGKVTGEYFKNCKVGKASSICYNDQLAANVWKETMSIMNLKDTESI